MHPCVGRQEPCRCTGCGQRSPNRPKRRVHRCAQARNCGNLRNFMCVAWGLALMVVVSSKRRVHRVCLEFKAFQKQCTWCRLYSKVFMPNVLFTKRRAGQEPGRRCAWGVQSVPKPACTGCRPGARQRVCLGSSKRSKSSVHRVQGVSHTSSGA